jgi:hypothetical protein
MMRNRGRWVLLTLVSNFFRLSVSEPCDGNEEAGMASGSRIL